MYLENKSYQETSDNWTITNTRHDIFSLASIIFLLLKVDSSGSEPYDLQKTSVDKSKSGIMPTLAPDITKVIRSLIQTSKKDCQILVEEAIINLSLNTQLRQYQFLIYIDNTCPPHDIQFISKVLGYYKKIYIIPRNRNKKQRTLNTFYWKHVVPEYQLIYVKTKYNDRDTSTSKQYTKFLINQVSNGIDIMDYHCVIPYNSRPSWKIKLRLEIQKAVAKNIRVNLFQRNKESYLIHKRWTSLLRHYHQKKTLHSGKRLLRYIPESIGIEAFENILEMLLAIM
jgi:hypothetical protein